MIKINANTKIAAILKENSNALEAIVSIDPKFEKLRIPLLRKVLASRTSIAMASKMAGCQVQDFFNKLQPLGFEIDAETLAIVEEKRELPDFVTSLAKEQIIDFDVREVLASGKDPLTLIMDKIKTVKAGQALKIINTFEPVPLIIMLEKKGYEVFADVINTDLVETYFYKKSDKSSVKTESAKNTSTNFEEEVSRFGENLVKVDVRELPMPQPMHTILGELETLPAETALYVHHKRIPVFLLPELVEMKFEYRIKEISDGDVRLLIYKS